MSLVAILVAGTTNMLSFVDSSTLGGGGGTVTTLNRAFTAGVNGSSFTIAGTFTAVLITNTTNTNGITPSDYTGVAGLRIVSATGGNTTIALTLPAGLDPFTGILYFQPS